MKKDDTVTIDAAGTSMGRVAAAAAKALQGKHRADYVARLISGTKVAIVNAGKTRHADGKLASTSTRYSGHPGGLTHETLKAEIARKGYYEAYRRVVRGMLPKNTLRDKVIQNLTVTD
jgi:large subunit ribosomal protein L13